jgi:hypothetical protein
MSLVEQPAPSHSTKPERQRALALSSRPHETGLPQLRMVRLTVNLPGDLVDRVRNAVYWSPSLKLSWRIAQSLRTSLAEMESSRQGRATSNGWSNHAVIPTCQAHQKRGSAFG